MIDRQQRIDAGRRPAVRSCSCRPVDHRPRTPAGQVGMPWMGKRSWTGSEVGGAVTQGSPCGTALLANEKTPLIHGETSAGRTVVPMVARGSEADVRGDRSDRVAWRVGCGARSVSGVGPTDIRPDRGLQLGLRRSRPYVLPQARSGLEGLFTRLHGKAGLSAVIASRSSLSNSGSPTAARWLSGCAGRTADLGTTATATIGCLLEEKRPRANVDEGA